MVTLGAWALVLAMGIITPAYMGFKVLVYSSPFLALLVIANPGGSFSMKLIILLCLGIMILIEAKGALLRDALGDWILQHSGYCRAVNAEFNNLTKKGGAFHELLTTLVFAAGAVIFFNLLSH
ncbi:MAG: hypothetical protein IJ802_06645 [Kiritimatiellae bacterium]|nr:hypothetical protein [Kiritimatiellia bacterium]